MNFLSPSALFITVIITVGTIWSAAGQTQTPASCPADLLLIIDNSGSVQDVFDKEKMLATTVVEQLDVGPTRVALVSFNQRAKVVLDFQVESQSKREILGILGNLSQEGGTTNTADSLQVAKGDFSRNSRPGVTLVVVLITDGHSQNSLDDLKAIMAQFNQSGINTLVATVSDNPDIREMSIYANGRADRTFLKNNLTRLPETVKSVANANCDQMVNEISVLKPEPIAVGKSECQAVDVVIVFDNSESVSVVVEKEKLVATTLLQLISSGRSQSHLALIHYSDAAKVAHSLSDPPNVESVVETLKNLKNLGGNTNTEAALNLALNEFSQFSRGNQSAKILLLLTDGHSLNTLENLKIVSDKIKLLGVQMFVASAAYDNGLDELEMFAAPRPYFLPQNLDSVVPEISKIFSLKSCSNAARDSPLLQNGVDTRKTDKNPLSRAIISDPPSPDTPKFPQNIFIAKNDTSRLNGAAPTFIPPPNRHVFLNFSYFVTTKKPIALDGGQSAETTSTPAASLDDQLMAKWFFFRDPKLDDAENINKPERIVGAA